MKWFLVPLLFFVATQVLTSHGRSDSDTDIEGGGEPEGEAGDESEESANNGGNSTDSSDGPDHPPDYDYPGFSRGSEYHAKAKGGKGMKEKGHHGEGGPKGHHRNDYGHWKIDCGTVDQKKMTIHHYGFGEAMYLVENSTCKAVAGEGHHHFILNDLMADSCCKKAVHKMSSTDVYTVEVVIQQDPTIRTHTDPVYYITCNYERTGKVKSATSSGKLKIHENSYQQRGRRMKTVVVDGSINMTVSLTVHDKDGNEVSEVYLGDWIQLRSYLHSPSESVASFKMFHCAAHSAKTKKNSYDILVKGCGVGNVIAEDRGFYTAPWEGPNDVKRAARSVFFQTFSVPDGDEVIYTCDFIICSNATSCDGASCQRSEMFQASCNQSEHNQPQAEAEAEAEAEVEAEAEAEAEPSPSPKTRLVDLRRKRSLEDEEIRNTVSSPSLKIHHRQDKNKEQEENKSRMNKDYYDPSKKPRQRGGPKEADSDDHDSYFIDTRERGRGYEPEQEDKDWMHIVLIVGLSLMAVILLAAVICICLVVKRVSNRRSSPSSWHQPTTPSQKELEYIDMTQGSQQLPPAVGYLYSPHWASSYGPGKPPKMEKY